MMKAIYFDMDGTIADLYGVEGWEKALRAEDATPYKVAKPIGNMSLLARRLNALQKRGMTIGIISWNAMGATTAYEEAVKAEKLAWLAKHLPSVRWDEVHIVAYGITKHEVVANAKEAILFDDNLAIEFDWTENGGAAYHPDDIQNILKRFF